MPERTEAEWRELVRQLRLIAGDHDEEYGRRQRALAILETVPTEFKTTKTAAFDFDFDLGPDDGKIV